MQVRGRIFPYPVLNNNQALSGFKDAEFKLEYEPVEDDSAYTLKGMSFSTDSKIINALFDDSEIGIRLVVECSYTVYGKSFELSRKPKDIILKKNDFTENVCVSLFAYAKEDFALSSDEFHDDYSGIDFPIEKYDIIAANDGFTITFRHDESADNVVKSIFSIIVNHENKDGPYEIDCDQNSRKIVVVLSEKDFDNYSIIRTAPIYREAFFCMLLVPALQEALNNCLNLVRYENKGIDEICDQYFWFRSVMGSFKKIEGKDLTTDDLKTIQSSSLAQKLLGNPLNTAMANLVETMKNPENGENDYEGN